MLEVDTMPTGLPEIGLAADHPGSTAYQGFDGTGNL